MLKPLQLNHSKLSTLLFLSDVALTSRYPTKRNQDIFEYQAPGQGVAVHAGWSLGLFRMAESKALIPQSLRNTLKKSHCCHHDSVRYDTVRYRLVYCNMVRYILNNKPSVILGNNQTRGRRKQLRVWLLSIDYEVFLWVIKLTSQCLLALIIPFLNLMLY